MQIFTNASPSSVRPGDVITTVIVVKNEGAVTAAGVTVTSSPPLLSRGVTRTWTASMIGAITGGASSGGDYIAETLVFPPLSQKTYILYDTIPAGFGGSAIYINRASYQQLPASVVFVDSNPVYVHPYGGLTIHPAGLADCDILEALRLNGFTTGSLLDVLPPSPTFCFGACGVAPAYAQGTTVAPSAGLGASTVEPGWNTGLTLTVNEECQTQALVQFNGFSSENGGVGGACAHGVHWRVTMDGATHIVVHPSFPGTVPGAAPCPASGIVAAYGVPLVSLAPGAHTFNLDFRRTGIGIGRANLAVVQFAAGCAT